MILNILTTALLFFGIGIVFGLLIFLIFEVSNALCIDSEVICILFLLSLLVTFGGLKIIPILICGVAVGLFLGTVVIAGIVLTLIIIGEIHYKIKEYIETNKKM